MGILILIHPLLDYDLNEFNYLVHKHPLCLVIHNLVVYGFSFCILGSPK